MTTCPLTAEERANQLFFCTVCRGGGDYIKDCSRCNGRGVVPPNKSDLIAGLKAYAAQQTAALTKDLAEAKHIHDSLHRSLRGEMRERAALRAERDELKAVVDKLPKTADGVTVEPKMQVYDPLEPNPQNIHWSLFMPSFDHAVGTYTRKPVRDCYSTPKAAEVSKTP